MENAAYTNLYTASGVEPLKVHHYPRVELTKQQKDWVRERDEGECQFPLSHICHGLIQLHHILPMSWGLNFEDMTPKEINSSENIISLCSDIHVGDPNKLPDPNVLHPEMRHAKIDYRMGDKDAFSKIGRHHRDLMSYGLKYWHARNDEHMLEVVRDRIYQMRDMRPYPQKRGE
jgi:HNH endonuclease